MGYGALPRQEARAIASHRLDDVSDATPPKGDPREQTAGTGARLARNLVLYTLARLGLVVVITAAIMGVAQLVSVEIPLVVAALFALIIAMPLSLTVFKRLRARVNDDIATVDAKRRQDKAQLRARLRGDDDSTGAAS